LRFLAGQPFICHSAALRPRALRPQLKRDPLGSEGPMTVGTSEALTFQIRLMAREAAKRSADSATLSSTIAGAGSDSAYLLELLRSSSFSKPHFRSTA